MSSYKDITTAAPDYAPMEFYSSGEDDSDDLAAMLADRMTGDMVAGTGDLAEASDDQPDAEIIDLPRAEGAE